MDNYTAMKSWNQRIFNEMCKNLVWFQVYKNITNKLRLGGFSWSEHHTIHQKVAGFTPWLGHVPGLQSLVMEHMGGSPSTFLSHIDMHVSLSFCLSSSLSKNEWIYPQVRIKKMFKNNTNKQKMENFLQIWLEGWV